MSTQRQLGWFVVAGSVGFIVDAAVLQLVVNAGLGPYSGRIISYLVAATATWWLNRRYTFRSPSSGRELPREWLRYVLANAVGGGVNYLVYALAVAQWSLVRDHLVVGVALGSIAGLGVNFIANKHWVFGRN